MSESNTDSLRPPGGRRVAESRRAAKNRQRRESREDARASGAEQSLARPAGRWLAAVLTVGWALAVLVATSRLAVEQGWWEQPEIIARTGGVIATWCAVVVLARRGGGRYVLIGLFAAVVLALISAFPENWALAGAAVAAASAHGLLGMLLSRPAAGLRSLFELAVSVAIGLAGAVVATAYDVELRSSRFRVLVLALVLLAAFAMAWRLGHGARSLGRRGLVAVCGGTVLLVVSVAYTEAIREWGSPELVQGLADAKVWVVDHFTAVPRPIEALVGFPALVWGVTIRNQRRQGWWMCAFGALGAAGVATSLVQQRVDLVESLAATGLAAVIGALLGLVIVAIDRLLTGPRGRRAQAHGRRLVERPEPSRFAPLV